MLAVSGAPDRLGWGANPPCIHVAGMNPYGWEMHPPSVLLSYMSVALTFLSPFISPSSVPFQTKSVKNFFGEHSPNPLVVLRPAVISSKFCEAEELNLVAQ